MFLRLALHFNSSIRNTIDIFLKAEDSIWQLHGNNGLHYPYITRNRAEQLHKLYGGKITLINTNE